MKETINQDAEISMCGLIERSNLSAIEFVPPVYQAAGLSVRERSSLQFASGEIRALYAVRTATSTALQNTSSHYL